MPLTAFLKIDDIAGESQRIEHEGEIDVHGLRWGAELATRSSRTRGRTRARAQVDNLELRKFYDASSPYLLLACMQGRAFPEMTLAVRRDSGEAHLDYLVITMTNVIIADLEMMDTDDLASGAIEERLAVAFEKVVVKYTIQADDHSPGDEHEIEYDIAAGI